MRACLVALLLLPIPAVAEDKKKGVELSEEEQGVLDQTNAERKAAGLGPLVPNEKLMKAARDHSANMAKQDKLEHVLDGKAPADRVKAVGYAFLRTGENVAWNQRDPAEVLKTWMASEGHKANILNKDYTEIGIGVATNDKGQRYWTQVFGKPR